MKQHASSVESGDAFPEAAQLSLWVEEYGQRLLKMAFSLLHDEFAAQDCVQEAFIKAGLKTHQLKNVDEPFPWLARIVLNECRAWQNKARRRRTYPQTDIRDAGVEDEYPSLGPRRVRELVSSLPYKQRTTLQLYYWSGYELREIARVMGVPETTCRVWLHRGRQKLKRMMGGLNDANE